MGFTDQQKRAIGARGKNLLVSAAAGSGKTTVLVERVLGLLREGVNIDEILIVTFTRAASADMRAKFYRRMSEEAERGDERMYEQIERLEFSSISTLHSFCTRVIRANFELADVDPNFRILTDAENALITERELSAVMEDAYGQNDEGFEALSFGRSDAALRSMVLALYDFLSARPDGEKWFEGAMKLVEDGGRAWIGELESCARSLMDDAAALGNYALEICKKPSGPAELINALEGEIGQIEAARDLDYESLRLFLSDLTSFRAGNKSKDGDIGLAESAAGLRKSMKELFPKAVKELVSLPLETTLSDLAYDAKAVKSLYSLASALSERLTDARRERCALTFNDLEHLTIRLIGDEGVRQRLRQKYKYIFVDEYQDTSDIQEAIVNGIAGENNRFMVGDVKQSIYRFRNAVPELFMEKYASYAEGGNNELIVLSQNFRSRTAVLDFVNLLFERVMRGGASEIVYDENARLNPGRKFEGKDAPVEVMLIDKSGAPAEEDANEEEDETDEEQKQAAEELKDAEREALLIAERIHSLMQEDKSLRYRDFCVITRVRKNVLSAMAAILAADGIPSYADESDSAFDAMEVSVLINLLRLLLSRRREIELLSVLRSPMFSLTANELALIRLAAPDGALWEGLEPNREKIGGVDRFLSLYEKWRLILPSVPLNALIRRILEDTGYYAFVGALPGGAHRQANIDMLCELAMGYEQTQGRSLSGFLEHMAQMKSIGDNSGAHELSENDDVVRLMTAHKSKGLEFKVVFASMLGRRFGGGQGGADCLIDKELGIALDHIDPELVSRRPTVATKAIRAESRRKDVAEELRVLYVTLTRAQERLILTGSVRDFEKSLVKWRLGREKTDLYKCALDIVISAVMGCPGCEALGESAEPDKPTVLFSLRAASGLLPRARREAQSVLDNVDRLLKSDLWDEETAEAYNWVYPNLDRPYAPLKLAVTGLNRELTGGKAEVRMKTRPAFLSGQDESVYTQRGTAVHVALQNLDYEPFRGMSDPFDISREAARQLNAMTDRMLLSPKERALVKPSVIASFVAGEIGQRLLRSPLVKREWSFTLLMPASRVVAGAPADENIVVQGSVDLCFLEDGEWVLVDYKTDRSGDDDEVLKRYGTQLDLYAEALETLTGKKVRQTLICLVSQGRQIETARKQS